MRKSRRYVGLLALSLLMIASLATAACSSDSGAETTGDLVLGEILIDPPVFLPSRQGTGNSQLLGFWSLFCAEP